MGDGSMRNKLYFGFERFMIPIPRLIWRKLIKGDARRIENSLDFMSEEHHLVRNFVVRELPCVGKPLSPEYIGQKLNLSVDTVNIILDELEQHKTFLFRKNSEAVDWAYPATVDSTPHHTTFKTGEQTNAA
jgi:hypothetical protein